MMKIFTVKRTINGKLFLKDEDRICARGWISAYIKLLIGITTGQFDPSCKIDGILIEEIPVSDDEMLDIMIDNKLIENNNERNK